MAQDTSTFTADGSGQTVTITPMYGFLGSIQSISIRRLISPASDATYPVKEFLTGSTDDGDAIFFRADTQEIQFTSSPEIFATPISVMTETERGSSVKCFVALEQEKFYELPGTVTKDVSILKISSQTGQTGAQATSPLTRSIRLSWRDSSLQLCRLIQAALIFLPTNADVAE